MEMELLGHLATLVSVMAMAFKSMIKLRSVSIVGSLMWIIYGMYTGTTPIITSSMLFIGVNGLGVYKEIKNKKDVK